MSGIGQFLLTDQVGSLRAVADTSGNIVKKIDYDSFGNIIADSNPAFSVPFGFAGGLHDRDTGLVRFGYRDYSPELGRFVAKDPIDFAGGDTNLYAYVMNDPINSVDPYGLWRMPDFVSINVNVAIPTPWTGTLIGITGAWSVDRYGNMYWGAGPNVGKSATFISGSATAGWLNQTCGPTEQQLGDFLSGHAVNVGGGYWGGVSGTYSPSTGGTATNVGFFTPQFGGGYTYSGQAGNLGLKW